MTETTYQDHRGTIRGHAYRRSLLTESARDDLRHLEWATRGEPSGELLRLLATTARELAERLDAAAEAAEAEGQARAALQAFWDEDASV